MRSTVTKSIEQAQYTAALAVTGAWKGTSRQKIYEELGWESMYDRRWYLCHFFQLRQSKTPEYLFNESPPERQIPDMIRNPRNYDPNLCRTNRFSNSYFINTIYEFKRSPLNAHRFRHNFDCQSPLCVCVTGDEDNEHFFLHCNLFQAMRNKLFGRLSEVP